MLNTFNFSQDPDDAVDFNIILLLVGWSLIGKPQIIWMSLQPEHLRASLACFACIVKGSYLAVEVGGFWR